MLNPFNWRKIAKQAHIVADPTATRDDLVIRDLMDFPGLRQAMGLALDHDQPEPQKVAA